MRARPILFSGPMIRALLAGTKTQTRRIVKGERASRGMESGWDLKPYGFLNDRQFAKAASPYGQPGDRLWVRESYSGPYILTGTPPRDWPPIADIWCWADGDPPRGDWTKPKPGMHMPRWASRITLEVTGVRVERLNDCSADDAKAEGITEFIGGWWSEHAAEDRAIQAGATPQEGYRHLWEQINGAGSWDANPWVWCVEFRRIEPAALAGKAGKE